MCKINRLLAMVSIAALLVGLSWVISPAAMAQSKIGVVDSQKAISECKPGKKAQVQLRSKADKLQADLNKLRDKVRKLRQELENTAMLLKPEAKLRKERDYDRMAKELRDRAQDAKRELEEDERSAFAPIVRNMALVIREIGQQGNYTLILDKRAVIYFPQSVDITAQVIAAYDKKHPK